MQGNGNSNYHVFQAVLKVREWRRFTSQFTYTWAHAFDDMTAYRGAVPQNSFSHKFSKDGVQWVDPDAFAQPGPGTYGNLPRNFLTGRGLQMWILRSSRTKK